MKQVRNRRVAELTRRRRAKSYSLSGNLLQSNFEDVSLVSSYQRREASRRHSWLFSDSSQCDIGGCWNNHRDWGAGVSRIDHTSGYSTVDASTPRQQQVQAFQVDLRDPDVELFTTPRTTNMRARQSAKLRASSFKLTGCKSPLTRGLYSPCCDNPSGTPMDVIRSGYPRGEVVISTGRTARLKCHNVYIQ